MPDDFGQAVRGARAAARLVVVDTPPPAPPVDDAPPPDDTPPRPEDALPPGCPIAALGRNGDTYYFLDALGQLQEYKAEKLQRSNIISLFGHRAGLLETYWPRRSQDKNTGEWIVTGWKPEDGQRDLVNACSLAGVWSPLDKVRGAGAWRGADDELILHLGDEVWIAPQERGAERLIYEPGLLSGRVYPTAPRIQRPWPKRQKTGPENGPGERLLQVLRTWQWARPDIDPILLLGWLGAARLAGALKWRPVVWLTGGAGTGKSTLQNLIAAMHGDDGLLKLDDASEAAVRQTVKYSTLPVAFDEAEPEAGDNRRLNALVKLARIAASGGRIGRGGQDHEASQFIIQFCPAFSSINVPSMSPQDVSRMAILSLRPLPIGAPPPALTDRQAGELGQRLLRRLADNWWRADDTIERYRDAMRQAGHSARGQDVFGTLLGCADLALYDEMPDPDSLAGWTDKMMSSDMSEMDTEMSEERACLRHLLTSPIENPKDRMRASVGQWIRWAAGQDDAVAVETAQRVLAEIGLKVDYSATPQPRWLIVGAQHQGLMRVYKDTRWGGTPGSTQVYAQALKRLPHELPRGADGKAKPIYIGGDVMRAFLLSIDLCLPPRPGGAKTNQSGAADDGSWSVGIASPRDGPAPDATLI